MKNIAKYWFFFFFFFFALFLFKRGIVVFAIMPGKNRGKQQHTTQRWFIVSTDLTLKAFATVCTQ
jgi:hypothetical protein